MNLKFLLPATLLLGACTAHGGNVTVKLPENNRPDTVYVSRVLMSELMTNGNRPRMTIDTIPLTSSTFNYKPDSSGAARYDLILNPNDKSVVWYAEPTDELFVEVKKIEPLDYTVGGTELMDGITTLQERLLPIEQRFNTLRMNEPDNKIALLSVVDEYNKVIENFIKQNPGSPAAPFALLNYDGADYTSLYDSLLPSARESMFYAAATQQKAAIAQQQEMQQKQNALISGEVRAPDFTLPTPDGKKVSLSDFSGKWVVIDFWGAWCPWCIKGFPALKEAYAKYAGKMEVIGVDCRDTDSEWRDAIKKYDLPWVNVYNGKGDKILSEYAVQGFPTKIIVSPEGKIAGLAVGEDPEFFVTLENLISGK